MNITIGNSNPDDELISVRVSYYEIINDRGHSADVVVWVRNVDSRDELRSLAKAEAVKFLQLALSAHSVEDQ